MEAADGQAVPVVFFVLSRWSRVGKDKTSMTLVEKTENKEENC